MKIQVIRAKVKRDELVLMKPRVVIATGSASMIIPHDAEWQRQNDNGNMQ